VGKRSGRAALALGVGVALCAALALGIYHLTVRSPGAMAADAGPRVAPARARSDAGVPPTLFTGPLRLGLHAEVSLLASVDLDSGALGKLDRGLLNTNLRRLAKRGFTLLLVDVLEGRGRYPFESARLKRRLYQQGPRLLKAAVREAHRHELRVLADLSLLAQRLDLSRARARKLRGQPLGAEELAQLAARLLRELRFDGLVARGFPASYRRALREVARREGKLLVVCASLPEPAMMVTPASRPGAGRGRDIWLGEDALLSLNGAAGLVAARAQGIAGGTVGATTLRLSVGLTERRRLWSEVGPHGALPAGVGRNLLLLRAIQFGGDSYIWRLRRRDGVRWLASELRPAHLLDELGRLRHRPSAAAVGERARPLLNVVLALPPGATGGSAGGRFVRQVVGPLLDGALLAGYEVRTTRDVPLPDAAAYALVAVGKTAEADQPLPAAAATLLARDVPLLMLVDGLSAEASWRMIYPKLGVAVEAKPMLRVGAIGRARWGAKTLRWNGVTLQGKARTAALPIGVVSGEVVVQAKVGKLDSALVVRRGERVLVNASSLHQDTTQLLALLLARLRDPSSPGTLASSFAGHGVVARRSAFFASAATPLKVRLPHAPGTRLRLTRFGADGRRQTVEMLRYQAPLSTVLERHQLLVVEPVAR
jgi:hypothetical protein